MEYNKVAAKWWADKLREVNLGNFGDGVNYTVGMKAMFLSTMLAKDYQPSDEAIDLFEKRLANIIKKQVEAHGFMNLSVGYGPDPILVNLAHKTGVSTCRFPFKTSMWIEKDKVSVRAGHDAPCEIIFRK